ncbi:MAG: hypothetical protein ACYCU7_12110 [Acidimicrobiales bacterium]
MAKGFGLRGEPLLLSGARKPHEPDLRRQYLERRDGSAGRTDE